ncbi:MAG: hypothetical protein J6W42_06240 [Bacteroidaceae bacterium]|nr:hypothetical protein [Bacteroidaceae bacterium]
MKPFPLLALTSLLICSCSNRHRVAVDVIETDFLNKSEVTVHGVPVEASLPLGASGIAVCDTFIIVTSGGNQARLHVYSTHWQPLGSFCNIGRARNEFLYSVGLTYGQFFKTDDGSILVPLVDGRSGGIKVLDLTESLKRQSTVLVQQRDDYYAYRFIKLNLDGAEVGFAAPREFQFLNNDIYNTFEYNAALTVHPDFYEEPYYSISRDTTEIKRIKFLTSIDLEDIDYYEGSILKHPDRNLIIQPFSTMDYILFIDIDKDNTFAVHQAGSLSFDDRLPTYEMTEGVTEDGLQYIEDNMIQHFGHAASADSFFMVLYFAGDYSINTPDPENPLAELLFFDWDGKFLKSVKLDAPVWDIAYDKSRQILYGMDGFNEEIYSFDLTAVLPD